MAYASDAPRHKTVGLRDVVPALVAPRRVFARVEDVAVYGWPLVVLLTVVTVLGYAQVETGLVDREIELALRERIGVLESEQRDVVERSALRDLYEQERKAADFTKILTRIRVIAAQPAKLLATVLLLAAALYGVVALGGRKPEWHTLMTICVFAGFVEVLRLLATLLLMMHHGALDVDTSAALLTRLPQLPGKLSQSRLELAAGLLSALDPFRIWFWWLVLVGLRMTTQLCGWRAWLTCGAFWLVGAGGRAALAVAVFQATAAGGSPGG